MKQPCVYIVASKRNGALYTGVTSNLPQRAHQHREGMVPGFTARYGCKTLIWYELHDRMEEASRVKSRSKPAYAARSWR